MFSMDSLNEKLNRNTCGIFRLNCCVGKEMIFLAFLTVTLGMEVSHGISLDELLQRHTTESPQTWTGRYFPTPPITVKKPTKNHGGISMGAVNPACDDGKTNLTVDWNFSPINYTCYNPNNRFIPDPDVQPILEIENIPKLYSARHVCMNETISYDNPLPTFGPHRPAWPRYGEYKFLPVQRWLHNLEHGAIVMLYHPCAHPLEVERLRRILRSCLYRHIIARSNQLSSVRPLALLSWGKRLTLSTVNKEIVKDFIMDNALHGPEKVSRDGQFDASLLIPAKIRSDVDDSNVCPDKELDDISFYW